MPDIDPRQPADSLQVSHPPNTEQGVSAVGSEKGHSQGDHVGSGGGEDSSHAWVRTHVCKPNLQPGKP